jgi:hypothetical protein
MFVPVVLDSIDSIDICPLEITARCLILGYGTLTACNSCVHQYVTQLHLRHYRPPRHRLLRRLRKVRHPARARRCFQYLARSAAAREAER